MRTGYVSHGASGKSWHIGPVAPSIFKGVKRGDRVGNNLGMVRVNLIFVELEILQQIEIVVIEVGKTSVKF